MAAKAEQCFHAFTSKQQALCHYFAAVTAVGSKVLHSSDADQSPDEGRRWARAGE